MHAVLWLFIFERVRIHLGIAPHEKFPCRYQDEVHCHIWSQRQGQCVLGRRLPRAQLSSKFCGAMIALSDLFSRGARHDLRQCRRRIGAQASQRLRIVIHLFVNLSCEHLEKHAAHAVKIRSGLEVGARALLLR